MRDDAKAGDGQRGVEVKKELLDVLKAADVAVWAWAVKKNSKRRGAVDFNGAMDGLTEALQTYEMSNQVIVLSGNPMNAGLNEGMDIPHAKNQSRKE